MLLFLKVDLLQNRINLWAAGRILEGAGETLTFGLSPSNSQEPEENSRSWMVARPENSPMTLDLAPKEKKKKKEPLIKEKRGLALFEPRVPHMCLRAILKYGQENPPLQLAAEQAGTAEEKNF